MFEQVHKKLMQSKLNRRTCPLKLVKILQCNVLLMLHKQKLKWVEEYIDHVDGKTRIISMFDKLTPLFPKNHSKYSNFHIDSDNTSYWNLVIVDVAVDDGGTYACQTKRNSVPAIFSYNLFVNGKSTLLCFKNFLKNSKTFQNLIW